MDLRRRRVPRRPRINASVWMRMIILKVTRLRDCVAVMVVPLPRNDGEYFIARGFIERRFYPEKSDFVPYIGGRHFYVGVVNIVLSPA